MSDKEDKRSLTRSESENEDNSEDELTNSENEEESSGEYDIIDVTDDPLYQVLSAFFETEDGDNLCDILKDLSSAVRENTKIMSKILAQKSTK
jgi:hypothetical protein